MVSEGVVSEGVISEDVVSEGLPVSIEIYKDDFRACDDAVKVLLSEVNDRVFCNILCFALQLQQVINNPCGEERTGGSVEERMWMEGRKKQERGVEEGREYGGKERERHSAFIYIANKLLVKITLSTHKHTHTHQLGPVCLILLRLILVLSTPILSNLVLSNNTS